MHLSSKRFVFDHDTKEWSIQTSKLQCAIPDWSPLFPDEISEKGIFFYHSRNPDIDNPDIIRFSLLKTIRNKNKDIDYWFLQPIPDDARDYKMRGITMLIYNDQEFA